MSRFRALSLATAVIAAGLVAWLFLLDGDGGAERTLRSAPDETARETVADSASIAAGTSRVEPLALSSAPTATLSSPDQRPGESDTLYRARRIMLRAYGDFRQEAALSPGQDRDVRRILADAQHEWVQLELYQGSLRDPSLMLQEVKRNPVRTFNEEFEVRLAEVLSDEQLAAYRRHLGGAHQFCSFAPLNVPLPPAFARYGTIGL